MSDVRLVIFDCDGVLVDSERISNRVLAEALTTEGLPTSLEEALAQYKGLLLSDTVARAENKLGRALPKGWVTEYERKRIEAFRRELEPVPGATQAVQRIIASPRKSRPDLGGGTDSRCLHGDLGDLCDRRARRCVRQLPAKARRGDRR